MTQMEQLLNKLLKQYYDMFNDPFPLDFLSMPDQKAVEIAAEILVDCLTKRKPYKVHLPKDALLCKG